MEMLVAIGLLWLILRRVAWRRRWRRGWRPGRPVPPPWGPPGWRPYPGEPRAGPVGGWHRQRRSTAGWRRGARMARTETDAIPAVSPAPALPPEDPVARLQRRWVAGQIDDLEFEAGLDAVYAERGRRSG